MTMIKYPKTGQFRNIIKNVKESHDFHGIDENGNPIREHRTPYPVLNFEATVKIHGTNVGIVFHADGRTQYQSRERILDVTADNAGFMQAMLSKNLDFMKDLYNFEETLAVFGEWCGSSIQKGVAISQMSQKVFVIFSVVADGVRHHVYEKMHDHSQGIYNVYDFPVWKFEIDFNNPIMAQQQIVDLTMQVEESCPVGKFFGFDGIGEGIVLRCIENPEHFFKSKGEKHSSSNVKKLASVDTEKVKNIQEFVDYAITENRMEQGLEHFTLENKNIGAYIKWVLNDAVSEELDVLTNSQLEVKDIGKAVSVKAREYFFKKMNEEVGV